MALLDRLLPAWRQSDPETRAAAVRQLGGEEQETLATVARRDEDAKVRRIAIRKLVDPVLLLEIGRADAEAELRDLATARAEQLLVERASTASTAEQASAALRLLDRVQPLIQVACHARDEGVGRAALERLSENRALAEVARRASSSVALEALQRLSEPTLLPRIALGAVHPEVALAALERITGVEALNEIVEDDQAPKNIRKRARTILSQLLNDDHLITAADRQERLLRLCIGVERLNAEADPTATLEALRLAEQRWEELSSRGAAEPELEERFRRARGEVEESVRKVEQRREREQRRGAVEQQRLTARREICDAIEQLEGGEIPARLAELQANWRALGPIDDPAGRELATRLVDAVERCERRHQRWQARAELRAQLEALVEEAEQLFAAEDAQEALRRRTQLERRWARVEGSADGKKWMAEERVLQNRFVEAGYALRDQQEKAKIEREREDRAAQQKANELCERLESLARAETLAKEDAHSALTEVAEVLLQRPLPPAIRPLRERLAAARLALQGRFAEQEKQEDWKRWANTEIQQQLIARAEALLAAGDPQPILKEVGSIDREWKRSTESAPTPQALWHRFRKVRDPLQKITDAYLAENLAKKEALCVAVDELVDKALGAGSGRVDWNGLAQEIMRLQSEWKQIGPVRQRLSDALYERFRAPANRFFEQRKVDLQARKERRGERLGELQTLCEQAEAIADSSDWQSAFHEMRRLQAATQKLMPPRRALRRSAGDGESSSEPLRPADPALASLHDRFASACERFFERYRRRGDIELQAKIEVAEAILVDLEALQASLGGEEAPGPEQVGQQLDEALGRWRRLETLPTEIEKGLRQRFEACCLAIEAACPELPETELANLGQREKLCSRLERVQAELREMGDAPSASDLAERLRLAMAANTIGGRAGTARDREREDRKAEIDRLVAKWERLGPPIGPQARALAQRFEAARSRAAGG